MHRTIPEWLQYFEGNASANHEIPWEQGPSGDPAQALPLARSLSHFELGESGEGKRIKGLAAQTAVEKGEPTYFPAVERFVKEENRHAELLAKAVTHLGGKKTLSHWTETMFVTLRRLLSLRTEIQVLAIAEIIGLSFYSMIKARTLDPSIRSMCDIFFTEETQHLAFDADVIRWLSGGTPSLFRRACAYVLFLGAITAAWVDHREALKVHGYSFSAWVRHTSNVNRSFNARRDTV